MSRRGHPPFSVVPPIVRLRNVKCFHEIFLLDGKVAQRLYMEERGPRNAWEHGGKAYRRAFIKHLY